MVIVENSPVDTGLLEGMIKDPEDLRLVWPKALYPFDHGQWEKILDPAKGIVSFLVFEGERLIGHAALDRSDEPQTTVVRFLYIIPEFRSRGMGQRLLSLLEDYARERCNARRLVLRVRTFNARAVRCYSKSGFREFYREDSLVMMEKDI